MDGLIQMLDYQADTTMFMGANKYICITILILGFGLCAQCVGAKVLYVDDDATGANNGSNWQNAYRCLQDALAYAQDAAKPLEIRVAQGIYKPDQNLVYSSRGGYRVQSSRDRSASFTLINKVALRGGYAGIGESDPNARDFVAFETILSGDLAGNDADVNDPVALPDEPSRSENAKHVISSGGTDASAVLGGFTITAGSSDGHAGGMQFSYANPTVSDCVFYRNTAADSGGAMSMSSAQEMMLTRCTFTQNAAKRNGGGINFSSSSVLLLDCVFDGNIAGAGSEGSGGGLCGLYHSDLELKNCTLRNNQTINLKGGAINSDYRVTLTECGILGNQARWGGGIWIEAGSAELSDCLFQENVGHSGAGGFNIGNRAHLSLANCTFRSNSGESGGGGGLDIHDVVSATITSCSFLDNSAASSAGAALDGHQGEVIVSDCEFVQNNATGDIGGVSSGSGVTMLNCVFRENTARQGAGGIRAYGSTLINCRFEGNSATAYGGGAEIAAGALVSDCTFTKNRAAYGGAISNDGGDPSSVSGCLFRANQAGVAGGAYYRRNDGSTIFKGGRFYSNTANSGGAAYHADASIEGAPEIEGIYLDCLFQNNSAERGAAIYCQENNYISMVNCAISGNRAIREGAGIYIRQCFLDMANCEFVGNSAREGAAIWTQGSTLSLVNGTCTANVASGNVGGIFCAQSSLTLSNSILWGNHEGSGDLSKKAQVYTDGQPLDINFSCVQGWTGRDSHRNIGADPLFVRVPDHGGDGWGDNPATADVNEADNDDFGKLWLQADSPCINAGNNALLPLDVLDLDGDGDVSEPLPVDLDGGSRIVNDTVDMGAYEYRGVSVVYVDSRASGSNTGVNWPNAYDHLQDALIAARDMVKPVEIRMAQGQYRPDQGMNQVSGNREATFQLVNWVTIKGGYAGINAPDPDAHDILLHETTLTGDLKNDDSSVLTQTASLLNRFDRVDNAYHVVTATGVDETAGLEGVTVYGGQANGFAALGQGGGLYIDAGYPTITNCRFRDNAGLDGGGLYCTDSNPSLITCDFTSNEAEDWGGAFYADYRSEASLTECVFSKNSAGLGGGAAYSGNSILTAFRCQFKTNQAGDRGGGLYSFDSDVQLSTCTFSGNSAIIGGGYFSHKSRPVLMGCAFRGNQASQGAGLYSQRLSFVSLASCLFSQNRAAERGGGLFGQSSDIEMMNCTLINNIAQWQGGGAYNAYSDVTLTNCLLWSNLAAADPEFSSFQSTVDLQGSYCNVRGGLTPGDNADGNLDEDPCLTPDGHLTADSPCIDAGNSYAVSVDEPAAQDFDADLRVFDDPNVPDTGVGFARIVDIGADEFVDSDGDRLPDWWELKYFGDPNGADPDHDSDGDGIVNLAEYELYSSHPTAPAFYVDFVHGSDINADGTFDHPFASIQQGLDAADDGDTVVVLPGTYQGEGNRDLDFQGRSIVLYAPDGPDTTVIDCEGMTRAFDFASGEGAGSAVVGFVVTGGHAEQGGAVRCEQSGPQLRHCVIRDSSDTQHYAGSLSGHLCYPVLADCILVDNDANSILLEHSLVQIQGLVDLSSDQWRGQDLMFFGSGRVNLQSEATLSLQDARIRCDLSGTGMIHVPLGSALTLEGTAQVHLEEDGTHGQILCDGLLRIRQQAHMRDTHIMVTRASFENDVIISNSVITAEAGSPYGQFFVEDTVQITGNEIHADGDRYMDLDPSVFQGIVADNRIYITITEGQGNTLGGLLELRARDLDDPVCPLDQFLCPVDQVPAFDATTWTIERLELLADAKVNLTNRFDFGNGDQDEVMYVKELVLHDHAVLNTAFNHLYYQDLDMADTATITDVPILGFSLNNIAFDHADDFSSRIVHNNYQHPQEPLYNRLHVQHITGQGPDPAGMMAMVTLKERDPDSAYYGLTLPARAKGLFAKSSEPEILVRFEYLFETVDPDTTLIVYLSDVPQLLAKSDADWQDHYLEVARIPVPPEGRPGSVGSERFGLFQTVVSKGTLNFLRGTRVELELTGSAGSCVFIDNFDPGIRCIGHCGDVAGFPRGQINAIDTLAVLSESGRLVSTVNPLTGTSASCLDSAFCADGVVTLADALTVNLQCGTSGQLQSLRLTGLGGATGDLEAPLLIAGKPYSTVGEFPVDQIQGFDSSLTRVDTVNVVHGDQYYTRLVSEPKSSELYQLHQQRGLVRLSDGQAVIPPEVFSDIPEPRYGTPAQVVIGLHVDQAGSRPLQDVAFDSQGYAYVVPVVVEPQGQGRYLTGAKLALRANQDPPYEVVEILGTVGPTDNLYDTGTHEIEVDSAGRVLRLNAHTDNESDMLWVYEGDTSVASITIKLSGPASLGIPAPTALHVSAHDGSIYLASKLNEPDALSTILYRITGDFSTIEQIEIPGMGHITGIASDPSSDVVWVVGYLFTRMPSESELQRGMPSLYTDPFYSGCVVRIVSGQVEEVKDLLDMGLDIALPVAVVRTKGD